MLVKSNLEISTIIVSVYLKDIKNFPNDIYWLSKIIS